MENKKLTDWMRNDAKNCGIFAPPMESNMAIDFLRRYLLGEDWYSLSPVSTEQINTEIVHEILLKYSRKYRKEYRKAFKAVMREKRKQLKV